MFTIKAISNVKNEQPYLCGVFPTMEKCNVALTNYGKGVNYFIEEVNNGVTDFPFYIIDSEQKFSFCQELEDVKNTISVWDLEQLKDDDNTYFGLYFIENYFEGEKNGADRMGSLEHIKVSDKELKRIKNDATIF